MKPKRTSRKEFEAWAARQGYQVDRFKPEGPYVTCVVNDYWLCWQAARRTGRGRKHG